MLLVIQHWVVPAIAIKFGRCRSIPSLLIQFSVTTPLRMIWPLILCNVICCILGINKHFLITGS